MTSWIETINEISARNNDFDGVRRERIRDVEHITGRPLVIYASAFLSTGPKVVLAGNDLNINHTDKVAFNEVIENIEGDKLDILLHSPGGSPDAAEAIVMLLRARHARRYTSSAGRLESISGNWCDT